jgi:hypothetical protein
VSSFFSQQVRIGRGIAKLRLKYPERLPWGWLQELRAWIAIAGFAFIAGQAAIQLQFCDGKKAHAYDHYFTFLRKLAVRVGFVWETFARDQR